jgi:hypothetical protein
MKYKTPHWKKAKTVDACCNFEKPLYRLISKSVFCDIAQGIYVDDQFLQVKSYCCKLHYRTIQIFDLLLSSLFAISK